MAKFIRIDSVYKNCLHKSFKQVLTKLLCLKFYSLIFNGCFDWTISNCAHFFLQYKNGQHCTNCIAKLPRIEIPLGQSIMSLVTIHTKYCTLFDLSSYILRRPQKFAKSPHIIWLAVHRTNNCWRIRKNLWPSQNMYMNFSNYYIRRQSFTYCTIIYY